MRVLFSLNVPESNLSSAANTPQKKKPKKMKLIAVEDKSLFPKILEKISGTFFKSSNRVVISQEQSLSQQSNLSRMYEQPVPTHAGSQ